MSFAISVAPHEYVKEHGLGSRMISLGGTKAPSGAPENEPDKSTFDGGGERGYIDDPTLDTVSQSVSS